MTMRRRRVLAAAMGGMVGPVMARAGAGSGVGGALIMATGEPGGGFADFGPQWGERAARMTGLAVSYRASGGSAANILLVEQGAAQLGLTTMAVAAQAWQGDGAWTEHVKLRGFRALFPIYQASWQVIAPRGGRIRRIEDLAGLVVGVGPAGGASAVLTGPVLAAAGVRPLLLVTGLYREQIALMRAGRLGACAFIGVTPLPALMAAARDGGFNLIGMDQQQREAVRRRVAGTRLATIAPPSLPGQRVSVATIGTVAIAVGRVDLPDALVGRLTAAALDHQIVLGGGVAARDWIGDDDHVAIHPGAVAVLRRYGFAAPARLIGRG